MHRQEIGRIQKKVKQEKDLRTRKKIYLMIEKKGRPQLEIDLERNITMRADQDQEIDQRKENPETIAQGVEEMKLQDQRLERLQEIDPEIGIETVGIETHVATEAVLQVLHVDIEVGEMTTPAIGTAEGHAKRP